MEGGGRQRSVKSVTLSSRWLYTDKKTQIFLMYKEIQNGEVANSYMRKGFLIYEEMHKYLPTGARWSCMTSQLLHYEFPYI
jgi:hypothetical protein